MKLFKSITAVLFISLLTFACGSQESGDGAESTEAMKSGINAKVVALKSRAALIRTGVKKHLEQGMVLKKGDKIQSMLGAKVDIMIKNRGVISLRNRSTLVLNAMEINKRIKVNLKQGKLLCALKKLEKDQQFSVSTPTGVAGIRGTSFVMTIDKEASKLSVLTGKVEVKNNKGQSQVVEQKKETSFNDKDITDKTTIRGSSIADVKEILTIKGVETSGEVETMKKFIKALTILDKKAAEDVAVDRKVKAQKLKSTQKDVKVKEAEKKSSTEKIEDKSQNFGDDSEMMIK